MVLIVAAWRDSADIAAPVQPYGCGRAPREIQVAAEGTHARGFGAGDRHVPADPGAGIADHDILTLHLAGDRFDHAFDDPRDLENACVTLEVINDFLGAHAQETGGRDFEHSAVLHRPM